MLSPCSVTLVHWFALLGGSLRETKGSNRINKVGAGGGNRTHTGISPTDFHTSYDFRRHPLGCLWPGLSLHHASASRRVGAARLVSTPSSALSRQGLARDRHLTGFPEFEQFCIAGFPASTQSSLSPLRLPIPPRPQCQHCHSSNLARRQEPSRQ